MNSGLFRVWRKTSGERYTVYHVVQSHGYPHFLIRDDGQWKYMSAKHFRPDNIGWFNRHRRKVKRDGV